MSLENEDMHEVVPDVKDLLGIKEVDKEKKNKTINVDADEVLKPMKSQALIYK